MTDGKDETWSPAEMSVARRRPWSVVADCSTPALQPQKTRGHREMIDGLTAPASSESRLSDSTERELLTINIVVMCGGVDASSGDTDKLP